jgi:hypothetical protein
MSTILNSSGLTFPDSTTQSTTGIPLTGNVTLDSGVAISQQALNINVPGGTWSGTANGGQKNIRQWYATWSQPSNTTYDMISTTGSYEDCPFILVTSCYHSGISYQMWEGVFGGYGLSSTGYGSGAFSLSCSSTSTGTLRLSCGSLTITATVYACMYIFGPQGMYANRGSILT